MKFIYVLLFIVLPFYSFAQKESHLKAFQNFRKDFNSKDFNAIYQNFSPAMQKHMAYQGLERFLMDLRFKAGPIESYEFIKYEDEKLASFRSDFNINSYKIDISVDKNNMINGLFVNPYNGPRKPAVVNKLNLKQNNVIEAVFSKSNPLIDLIYSHTKHLPNHTQLSIAILYKGKTEYYGVIKENDTVKSIENQSALFDISSFSHIFVSSILSSLTIDNQLNLTDNINQFFPFEFNNNQTINFKDISNHTSGIENTSFNFKESDLADYLKNNLLLNAGSTKTYRFSNLNTEILKHSLEISQQTPFQNLLKDHILTRYNLNNTLFLQNEFNSDLTKSKMVFYPENSKNDNNSDTRLFSNVVDLEKFVKAQFDSNNKELELMQQPTFEINNLKAVGLGWNIIKNGKEKLYFHENENTNYRSSIVFNLNKQTGIIILSNVSSLDEYAGNIQELAFKLEKLYK